MARWTNEHKYDDAIAAAHRAFPQVPVSVIKAVIAQESGFREGARRGEAHIGDASIGLMQLLMRTAKGLGYGGSVENLYVPGINVYYGTKLLSENYQRSGNWEDAISAYNGGFRPNIGFGRKATRVIRGICLERNKAGDCVKRATVAIGEYSNQDYVDRVRQHMAYFAHDRAAGTTPRARETYTPPQRETVITRERPKGGTTTLMLVLAGAAALAFTMLTRVR